MPPFLPMKAHLEFVHSSYSGSSMGSQSVGAAHLSLAAFPQTEGANIHPAPRPRLFRDTWSCWGGWLKGKEYARGVALVPGIPHSP